MRAARRAVLPHLRGPQTANTLETKLIGDFIADAAIAIIQPKLAPLAAFSTDFGTDPLKPRATVQVAKATAGATTLTNPTNFETGDSTLAAVTVTVDQKTQPFHLSNDAVNQGYKLAQLATINADIFANAISDIYTALMIVANYGATTVIGVAASFDSADLPAIFGLAKNYMQRNLLLDGSHLAGLIPTNQQSFTLGQAGAFGFNRIEMQNRWTGAVANTVGFVCDVTAIAVASGLPINQPAGEFLAQDNILLPKLGLSIQFNNWYSRATRSLWASYDVVFGAAVGDGGAAEVLVSA